MSDTSSNRTPEPDDPEEIELLRRRLREREQELSRLEKDLEGVESWLMEEDSSREDHADSEVARLSDLADKEQERARVETMTIKTHREASRLEPQFKAALGGVDREALRVLSERAENLELRLEHLRILVENSQAQQAGAVDQLLGACRRMETRELERDQERILRQRSWKRTGTVLGLAGLFLVAWYILTLGFLD